MLQKRTDDLQGPQKFACGAYKHTKHEEQLEISIYTAGGGDKIDLRSDPYLIFGNFENSANFTSIYPGICGGKPIHHS